MNIYVGNLSPETTEDDLRQTFEAFGQVISVKILKDRVTGESNRFGFVGMPVSDEGQTAISELNGKNLKGHAVKVEEGKRKTGHRSDQDRPDGSGSDRGDRDRRDRFERGGRRGRRY
ncbi:MAG: RNA recognition motif domain-containing protein [Planctomycetota bacterium]|jgi:RNA recognition motif-containing protein